MNKSYTEQDIQNILVKAPKSYRKSEEFQCVIVYGNSIFKDLAISDVVITPQGSGTKGEDRIDFNGKLNLDASPGLAPLKRLLDLKNQSIVISGSIQNVNTEAPIIDLRAELPDRVLKSLKFMNLNVEVQYIKIFTLYPQGRDLASSQATAFCHVKTDGNNPILFNLVATMTELDDTWEFSFIEGNNGRIVGNGIEFLSILAGGLSLEDFGLPDALNGLLEGLYLRAFKIKLNPFHPNQISYIVFEIALQKKWEVIKGVLEISQPSIGIFISSPLSSTYRVIHPYVKGTFELGKTNKVHLDVEAECIDNYSITAKLREGDTIKVTDAIYSFTTLSDLPEVDIDWLFITADSSGYLLFECGLKESWPISPVTIQEIRVLLERSTDGKFTGSLSGKILLSGRKISLIASQLVPGSGWQFKIAIADLYFDLSFDRDPNSKTFIATYNNPTGKSQDIKKLAEKVSSAIASFIPKGLTITLKDALFAYSATSDNQTKLLFIFHIDNGINLSSLPLVGKLFPPNQTIQLHYQILAASDHFSTDDVTQLKTLVTKDIFELPTKDIGKKGLPFFGLAVTVQLGDAIEQLNLPILVDSSSNQTTPTHKTTDSNSSKLAPTNQTTASVSNDASLTTSEGVKWSFGPVHFHKIGVKCQDQKLWFLLDASLVAAGLMISLDGLAVSSPLTELKPEFHLNGLGIDYRSDTIEIGGTLLKYENEYVGAAILRTQTKKGKSLTLSALGSYTDNEGHPSLFVYALLDYPLGGAPFLFITGLAAAFGYNRTLRLPDKVQDVAQFPLVRIATGEEENWKTLNSSIPPATGEIFFAVGIKFTSFKIINSIALLTVQLGNRSEINILGLSTLIAPPGETNVEPVAKAQLAFRATYLPDEGFLKAEAALLPGAYLFSDKCHLSGQFAFYSWFAGEHEGDFVLTLGGYHPDFEVPEHYPKLPRLQLNWQVDEKTFIKGDAYFALCAHALMAGGRLDITYESGNVKAWLRTEANFLIAWKPYHYDAHIHVTIGASYTYHLFGTYHISGEVGADLHLWGPDFGGKATIKLEIFQIDINFGSSSSEPEEFNWDKFKESFLPKDEEVCSIAVQSGLVQKVGNDKSNLGVINPKHFSLVTNSVIPSNKSVIQETTIIEKDQTIYYEDKDCNHPLPLAINNSRIFRCQAKSEDSKKIASPAIRSIGVPSKDLTITHTIKITGNQNNVYENFQYIPILKKVPAALWGEPPSKDKPLMPDVNGQQFIENALSGFEIKPKQQPDTGETHAINRSELEFSTGLLSNAYKWEDIKVFTPMSFQGKTEEKTEAKKQKISTIITESVKNTRNSLLQKLGISLQEIKKIDFKFINF